MTNFVDFPYPKAILKDMVIPFASGNADIRAYRPKGEQIQFAISLSVSLRSEIWSLGSVKVEISVPVKTELTIYDLGWTREQAVAIRAMYGSIAEDWDDPSMDIYDEI